MNYLETNRIILRKWVSEDIDPFTRINQDKRVVEFLRGKLSREEVEDFIFRMNNHFQEHGFSLLACVLKETNTLIGLLGLLNVPYQTHFTPAIEIGWRLDADYWGKGYATEAAHACLQKGFQEHNLKEIVSFTTVQNIRSRKVMERIGMKWDASGNFTHPKLPLDHPLSLHVLYRIKNTN